MKAVDFSSLAGLSWNGRNGQATLSGSLLKLYKALDAMFLRWAQDVQAAEFQFGVFLPARELQKLDYFNSFPHLISFPVFLESSDANLRAFQESRPVQEDGHIALTRTAPIHDCLTPAACYHFYVTFQGQRFSEPRYVTTRANCFRREKEYLPLRRQWCFGMREIVCLGTADEVKGFLKRYRDRVAAFFAETAFPVKWELATDPFFDPTKNPKFLMQQVDPVKTEMIFGEGEGLSIGSLNFHRTHFGEAFGIRRGEADVNSGCVAFGLERWIFAVLSVCGPDERNWPEALRGVL